MVLFLRLVERINSLLLINIGAPVIAGLACLVLTGRVARRVIVAALSAVLVSSSIILFFGGEFSYSPDPLAGVAAAALDLAVLSYFFLVGIKRRNPLIMGLSAVQLAPLAYFELTVSEVAIAPTIVVDNLAILMSMVVNVVGSLVCIYALGYMDEHEEGQKKSGQPRFFFFMLIFLGVMNGLVYSNGMLWLCLFWEGTTLCCYELIRHDRTAESERNAAVALWMGLVGGVALVATLFVGYYGFGIASVSELTTVGIAPLSLLGFALMALAAFTKSAQFPFHGWLLGAMVAPTPVSALLHSSTMVNAGVYLILRFSPAIRDTPLTWAIGLVGASTFMITAVMAINERVSKKILAYSTIGNLGLIIMCAGINTALSYSAALLLLLFHSVSKGLLFMGAGVVENRLRTRNIEDWEGLLGRLPLTATIMVLAMLSMFLPPFGMLLGKWTAIEALASAPPSITIFMIFLVIVGSAATTLFWAKWLGHLIIMPIQDAKRRPESLPLSYRLSLGSLLALTLALSIGAALLISNLVIPGDGGGYIIRIGTPLLNIETGVGVFPMWQLWLASCAILAAGYALTRIKGGTIKAPYVGGENVEGSPLKFRTAADTEAEFKVEGIFFSSYADRLNRYALAIGTILLIVVFLMVVL